MLKSLDILIGLAVIMLVLSMIVTVLTQIVNGILNSRGKHLKNGLADLLKQLDPKLDEIADQVAAAILTHPLIRENSLPFLKRAGTVIGREEFTKLLLELAAEEGPDEWKNDDQVKQVRGAVKAALEKSGLSDPGATLENARMLALKLESARPELANNVRHAMALLQEASSPFVARINAWFDQTMDRTAQRFTLTTRTITFICALLVGFGLQVDAIGLVNRLSMDEALRAELGEMANRVMATYETNRAVNDVLADPEFTKLTAEQKRERVRGRTAQVQELSNSGLDQTIALAEKRRAGEIPGGGPQAQLPEAEREYLSFLAEKGIVTLPPANRGAWSRSLAQKNLFGIIVSVCLLSLGAPFWYDALKKLINLRSVLAQKEDRQREERQTQQTPVMAVSATSVHPATLAAGERGDLGALG